MKIAIDTKEDSAEDIKKVIRMLQHLIGEHEDSMTNSPEVKEGLFSLFDSPQQQQEQDTTQQKDSFRVDEFLDEKDKEERDNRIVPYD